MLLSYIKPKIERIVATAKVRFTKEVFERKFQNQSVSIINNRNISIKRFLLFAYLLVLCSLFIYISYSDQVGKDNSNYVEIGTFDLPSNITKTAYLDTFDGKYIVESLNYSKNDKEYHDFHFRLFDTPKYIYVLNNEELIKFDKVQKNIEKDNISIQNKQEKLYQIYPVNDQFAFYITEDTGRTDYFYLTYLLNMETNEIRLVDYYKDNFEGLFPGPPYPEGFISPNTIVVSQSDGDACWANSLVTALNIDSLSVKNIGDFSYGCAIKIGKIGKSYLGLFDNQLLISDYEYNENEIYKNLELLDPLSGSKSVVFDEKNIPAGVQNIVLNSPNDIQLFITESEGFIFDYKNKALNKDLITIPEKPKETDKQKEVYNIEIQEEKLSNYKSAYIENVPFSNERYNPGIFVKDKNGTSSLLLSKRDWKYMLMKYRKLSLNGGAHTCTEEADYKFTNLKFRNNTIIVTISITPPTNLSFNCSRYIGFQTYETKLDLNNQKVYLKFSTK